MMSSSSIISCWGPDLSNIPVDILSEIIKRLEVLDNIRSGAVCRSWRNLSCGRNDCYKKTQFPWLTFSSSEKGIDDHRYLYSVAEKKRYEICLPGIGGRHFVGSSQGFLISIDTIADLYATNPITGTHIPLPPTSTYPRFADVVTDPETGQITHYVEDAPPWMLLGVDHDVPVLVSHYRDFHYEKVILSPSTDIAVAIDGLEQMAYARTTTGDNNNNKWTALRGAAGDSICVNDATFHKGSLHAVDATGKIAIFDDLTNGGGRATYVSPDVSLEGTFGGSGLPRIYLVESPDGEDLFFVYREMEEEEEEETGLLGHPITLDIKVFLLDKDTYTFKPITSLGDVALFVGSNHSMSLCTTREEYPALKRNSVYFTDDNKEAYNDMPQLAADMGVFNLEDKSIEPIYDVDTDLDRFRWPQPIWFMPTL